MSLLFTLSHAHRRVSLSFSPRNISITVYTHLSTDAASSSGSESLSLSSSLAFGLSKKIACSLRPYLFPSGFFFSVLLLSLCYLASTPLCTTFLASSFLSLSLHTDAFPRFNNFSSLFSLLLIAPTIGLSFVIFVEKIQRGRCIFFFFFLLAVIARTTLYLRKERERKTEQR